MLSRRFRAYLKREFFEDKPANRVSRWALAPVSSWLGVGWYLLARCQRKTSVNRKLFSPHERESKAVLHSGFHAVYSRLLVLDSSLCKWKLDSGFKVLVGFRIQDSDSTSKISRISDSTNLRVAAPPPPSPFFLCRGEGVATRRLGFHKLKFLGFRNLDSLTRSPTIQIHLH